MRVDGARLLACFLNSSNIDLTTYKHMIHSFSTTSSKHMIEARTLASTKKHRAFPCETQLKLSKQTPAKICQLPPVPRRQISARTFVPCLGKAKNNKGFVYLVSVLFMLCFVLC